MMLLEPLLVISLGSGTGRMTAYLMLEALLQKSCSQFAHQPKVCCSPGSVAQASLICKAGTIFLEPIEYGAIYT